MVAKGAHEHEPAYPRLLGGRDEVARPLAHDPLEFLRLSGDQRDQVDDRVCALGGAAKTLRVRRIAPGELAAPGGERSGGARGGVANQRANGPVLGAQRVDDLRAHEPGPAGDEDHAKFFQ